MFATNFIVSKSCRSLKTGDSEGWTRPMAAAAELVKLITTEWVHNNLGETDCMCVNVAVADVGAGCSSDIFLLTTLHSQGAAASACGDGRDSGTATRIRLVKTFVGEESLTRSRRLGLAREGLFLREFATARRALESGDTLVRSTMRQHLPRVVFADGNMATGSKLVIMEFLPGRHTGYFMREHHPVTWQGKPPGCPDLTEESPELDEEEEIVEETVRIVAQMHAAYWQHGEALERWDFLRGREACVDAAGRAPSDEDAPQWHAAQEAAREGWAWVQSNVLDVQARNGEAHTFLDDLRDTAFESVDGVRMPPHLIQCIEASLSRVDFGDYRAHFTDATRGDYMPWTVGTDSQKCSF